MPTGSSEPVEVPADGAHPDRQEHPGPGQTTDVCRDPVFLGIVTGRVIPPPIAHRGAGITAPTKTQAAVPDEPLAHQRWARIAALGAVAATRGGQASSVSRISGRAGSSLTRALN